MVGIQERGKSHKYIYNMAMRATKSFMDKEKNVADIGGGKGVFANRIQDRVAEIKIFDANPPEVENTVNESKIEAVKCNLNEKWPAESKSFDIIYALEVIEHVENTRLFMREVERIMRHEGIAFISTPNNESFFSRLNFLINGEHRYFQKSNYPAHINPILSSEIRRTCSEVGLKIEDFFYSREEVIPKFGVQLQGGGKLFSRNFGILCTKK